MAHSPGPWKAFLAGKSSNLAIGRAIEDDTYIVLARVSEVITGVGTPEANANLMAAAPDLLEVVEAFLDYARAFDLDYRLEAIEELARIAIAKARGSEGPVI